MPDTVLSAEERKRQKRKTVPHPHRGIWTYIIHPQVSYRCSAANLQPSSVSTISLQLGVSVVYVAEPSPN